MTNGIYCGARRAFAFVIALVMLFGCIGITAAETHEDEPVRGALSNYYLTGTMTGWSTTGNENYRFEQNSGNTSEYMLTVNLAANAEFKVIEPNGSGATWYPGGNNYQITQDGNYTIYFRPDYKGGDDWHEHCIYVVRNGNPVHSVTVSKTGEGTVSAPESAAVGDTVTVSVSPANGWYVDSVTGVSDWSLSGSTGTFTMPNSAVTLSVTFAQYPTLEANATNGGGTVTASVPFAAAGTSVSVTVTPNTGYEIDTITGLPEGYTESNGVYSFNMPSENVSVSVTFKQTDYAISVSKTGEGSGTVTVAETAHYNDSVTVTVAADAGSKLKKLTVDGTDVTAQVANGTYTFTMPAHAVAVEAEFRLLDTSAHAINVSVTGLGTAFADKTEAVVGETVTITVEASIGYEFAQIVVNEVGQGAGVLTFEMPDEDANVMVYFDNKPFAITLNSGVQGSMNAIPRNNQAYANTTVQIIVNADEEYAIKTLTVKNDTTGAVIATTLKSQEGQTSIYEFEMPASSVTVTATYHKKATNGYYLIGTHGWSVSDIDGNEKFVDDLSVSGQMFLTLDLTAGQKFQVVYVENGEIKTWFPGGETNNYEITTSGNYTIYFRSDYQGNADWHHRCIYAALHVNQYYLADANAGTIRRDDHLFVNKEFNCQEVAPGQNNQSIHDAYGVNYEHMVLTYLNSGDKIKVVRDRGNEMDWLPGGVANAYPEYLAETATQRQAYTGMVFVFFEEELVIFDSNGNVTGNKNRTDWTNNVFDVQKAYRVDAAEKASINPLNSESLTYNLAHGSISLSTGTPFIREGRPDESNIIYELGLNQKVYVSIIPEAGYALDGTPYITYGNNTTVNMTKEGNRWYFNMPSADVVIHAPMHKVFRTQSVLLSGTIGINFFVDLSTLTDAEKQNCVMKFFINGNLIDSDTFDPEYHSSVTPSNFGFTCHINALQMADSISAELYNGTSLVSKKSYSLEEYIRYYDRSDSNQNGVLNALRVIRAMSDYGYYTQQFQFSQKPEIADSYTAFNRVYTTKFDYSGITSATNSHALDAEGNKDIANSAIDHVGLQLAVDSATALMINLHMKDGWDFDTDEITINGGTLHVGESQTRGIFTWTLKKIEVENSSNVITDRYYQVVISGISTHNLDMQFTVTGNAGGSFTIKASAFSYVNSLLKNADLFVANADKARNVAAAIYMFHEAEVIFRGSDD